GERRQQGELVGGSDGGARAGLLQVDGNEQVAGKQSAPRQGPEGVNQVGDGGRFVQFDLERGRSHQLGVPGEGGHGESRHPADSSSSSATRRRNSLLGLKTGTGRAATSTGSPVRGLRAMRVLRRRILNVPKPRTSIF